MSFDTAFHFIMKWEGGSKVTRHPRDPGGLTKYGISQRSYPLHDIEGLSEGDAKKIYAADYWEATRCPDLSPAIALALFDSAVNQGPGAATRMLQKAVGVTADGSIGPITLSAIERKPQRTLLIDFMAKRIIRYTWASAWKTFNFGWMRRAVDCAIEAGKLT